MFLLNKKKSYAIDISLYPISKFVFTRIFSQLFASVALQDSTSANVPSAAAVSCAQRFGGDGGGRSKGFHPKMTIYRKP